MPLQMLTTRATPKATKQAARYTPAGGAERCGMCRHYAPSSSCARIEGPISAAGWCMLFSRQVTYADHAGQATVLGGPPGVTLDLSFMTPGTLDPRITFTRASTATYFDSSGVMQTAATNLALQSADLNNAVWAKGNGGSGAPVAPVTTANQATAPDGTLTAARIVYPAVASGGYSFVYQSIAVTAAVYTWSVWLRGNVGGERVYISATQNTSAYYELSCTLTTAWQRFSLKTPALSALVWLFQVGSDQRDPAQGVQSAATIFAWGAQVELGSSATFYIPTTTVANGAPRWDYDPVTHVLNGLRIEEARTNSVLNSATLVTQNVTVTAVPWTLSFYGTGTVTLSGVSTAGPLTGTGAANRVALAFTPTAGTLTLTVTGSVTSAQLEVGTFATSYIPTAGAAATRAIEICTMPTAAWFNTAVGSAVTDLMLPQVLSTGSNIEMLGLDQGATTDIIAARQSGASIIFSTNSFVAGVGKGGPGVAAPVLVAGLVSRAGFTYNVSSAVITVALNGSTVTSSTTTGLPTAISRCTFGTGRNTPLNGYLRRVRYWPRALTNAELQSVTT